MGTVYRKSYTKPLPADVEIINRKGKQLARWRDAKGKLRTALVTIPEKGEHKSQYRIVLIAGTYTAKYRNGAGQVVEVTTGCRDETAAKSVLAELEKRAELVKAGVITKAEDAVANHQKLSLSGHFDVFGVHLSSKGVTDSHRKTTISYLRRLSDECLFSKLADLDRSSLEKWLHQQTSSGVSACSRNAYRAAAMAFGNWCVDTDRLVVNPFKGVSKLNEKADPRRQRRALTESELQKLLETAHRRPLLDAMMVRRGKNKGKAIANVRPETRQRLEAVGRERALIYKTLILTGFRKGELASLTIGQLDLGGPVAYAHLLQLLVMVEN